MKARSMNQITTPFFNGTERQFPLFWLVLVIMGMLLVTTSVQAQSGSWDGWNEYAFGGNVNDGSGGYFDHGNGVIQLTNDVQSGCTASSIHSGLRYNACDSSFNECYRVLFGCGDGADGMAFSFSYGCDADQWQVWGCGGGLGYRHGCAWNQGVTIEFDTYDNLGDFDFDGNYEGGAGENEVTIHRNMEATDAGKVDGVAVPSLTDGLEHTVCISYDNTTSILSVTIDGDLVITRDLSADGIELQGGYFAGCELMTTWSAGTNDGVNFQAVSDGPTIYSQAGALCPQMPVEFLKVDARAASSAVMVSWSTAMEEFNEKFVIERSGDLVEWEAIGEVAGAGNSNTIIDYHFPDEDPLTGTGYYRIRQVDFDGTWAHSQVVSANMDVETVRIAPNPFEHTFTIYVPVSGAVEVTLRDVLGRVVHRAGSNVEGGVLDIRPDIPPGTYVVTIQTAAFSEQRKVVKR